MKTFKSLLLLFYNENRGDNVLADIAKRAGVILGVMFLILISGVAHATHVNIAVDTSKVCDFSELNVNILLLSSNADKAKVKVYLDDDYIKTLYLYPGEQHDFTIDVDDLSNGKHEISVRYYIYNEYNGDYYKIGEGIAHKYFYISCPPYNSNSHNGVRSILLYTNKDRVHVGEIIKVYGFVDSDTEHKVYVYLNNHYKGSVWTREQYFEKYLLIEKEGKNEIKVVSGGKVKKIYVYALPAEEKNQEEERWEERKGDVNIIVYNNTIRIYYGKTESKEEERVKYEYVDVQLSTKQLDMEEGKGNVIKVVVFNHMNESKLFKVNTSLDELYTYLPSPKVLGVKEKGEFDIYIKPNIKDGRNRREKIFVYMNNTKIKEIPFEIFIIKRRYEEREKRGFINLNLDLYSLLGLGIILLIIMVFYLYPKWGGEEMLKPKYYDITSEKAQG